MRVEATWNQGCIGLMGSATLSLGVVLRPGVGASLPLEAVVLLDRSSSMQGPKFTNAIAAVRTVWSRLREGDRLSLIAFSGSVNHVLQGAVKGRTPQSDIERALGGLQPEGCTRLDLGLAAALGAARSAPGGGGRFVWIVTDGDPTNAQGRVVADLAPYLQAAREGAEAGVTIGALGLGDAQDYQADFLRELSDRGRGVFCYAADAAGLSAQLAERLTFAQAISGQQGLLELSLTPGVVVHQVARVVPDYVPLDVASGGGPATTVALGAVQAPETVYIAEVQVTSPFGTSEGRRRVGTLRASAMVGDRRVEAPEVPLEIEHVRAPSARLSERHAPTERLRLIMRMEQAQQLRGRTQDPQELIKATGDLADLARQTGHVRLAADMEAQLRQLVAGARLSPDQQARASADIRSTGRLPGPKA